MDEVNLADLTRGEMIKSDRKALIAGWRQHVVQDTEPRKENMPKISGLWMIRPVKKVTITVVCASARIFMDW
jgi:hypothetical protein